MYALGFWASWLMVAVVCAAITLFASLGVYMVADCLAEMVA